MEDYILFYDGDKKTFVRVSFEELKMAICPEELDIRGVVVTHKNYKTQLDALLKESEEPVNLEGLINLSK